MSKGGPWFEPLSGLVVYVCIPGAAPGTTLAEPTTTLCRASGEERALGKLHYAAAANSPASSAPPLLGEAGTNSAARVPRTMGRFDGGALGDFEQRRRWWFPSDVSGKPVFGAYFWEQVKLFDF